MVDALATFIREAVRLRKYSEVRWAAERYRNLFPTNPIVEVCSAIAHVASGEDDKSCSILDELQTHGCDWKEITSVLRDVLGNQFQPRELTATAVLDAVVDAVRPERRRVFHPTHGN
jgi:hypothetical protein